MLSHNVRYALAASMPFALVTAGSSTNSTGNATESEIKAYCYDVVDLYQSSNASNTYTIPAVVQPLTSSANTSTAPLISNTTQVWQVRTVVGQLADSFFNVGEGPQLQTSIYLDPKSDAPMALPIPPALSTCKFIFGLPSSDDGKAPDDGDCSSLISKACVDDIQSNVRQLSQSIASSATMSLYQACNSIGQSLFTLPKSCPQGTKSDRFSLFESQGINLASSSNNTDCPNGPSRLPIPISGKYETYQPGNYTSYDNLVKKTTPVLLAFFTNGTLYSGTPFADTKLLCTSPKQIAAGSHNPTSAAEHSIKTDTKFLVGMALVMNALLFFML